MNDFGKLLGEPNAILAPPMSTLGEPRIPWLPLMCAPALELTPLAQIAKYPKMIIWG